MAFLTESAVYAANVYQIETTDPVEGGAAGTTNVPLIQINNRVVYLKQQMDIHDAIINNNRGKARNCVLNGGYGITTGPSIFAQATPSSRVIQINSGGYQGAAISFAAGHDEKGPIDYFEELPSIDVDIDFDDFVAVAASRLYVLARRNGPGDVVFEVTDTKPIFSEVELGSAESVPFETAPGRLIYNRVHNVMAEYNGSNWDAVQIVVLGEVTRTAFPNGYADDLFPYDFGFDHGACLEDVGEITIQTHVPAIGHFRGKLACDGAAVGRFEYGTLFKRIGTTYGVGNGTTTFNIPDYRGQFLRINDDLETATGAASVDTGRVLGSAQADDVKAHDHTVGVDQSGVADGVDHQALVSGTGDLSANFDTQNNGSATETRPVNVSVSAYIKY
jgi:microcystin-dependent protein